MEKKWKKTLFPSAFLSISDSIALSNSLFNLGIGALIFMIQKIQVELE
jgi:hypothetical protein